MSDKTFFDTNVLVYAFDQADTGKNTVARRLIHDHGPDGNLILSTQVLQEFYVVVTGKLAVPLSPKSAFEIVVDFSEFPLIQIDRNLIARSMKRHQEGAFSFWDCMIIEAALQAECNLLLSEDMQNGRKIESLVIRNPFVSSGKS